MTPALQKAIAAVRELPDDEQDAIAAIIVEEVAAIRQWDESFANSQRTLALLAKNVREDFRNGRVTEAGFDEL